ncbi:retrovirus-related pol polyprotein from transposon TNT 1-94, partial [Tanacetum coccineum]
MPTGRTFTLGEQCPLTRLIKPNKVSAIAYANPRNPTTIGDPTFQTLYFRLFSNVGLTDRPLVFGLRLFKTYDRGRSRLRNLVKKFIGTVRFGNDQFGAIMGYGDYVIGESVISRESVETIHEIVDEAKVERPLDRSLASACLYTKHSQELLEYVIDTCPKDLNPRDKRHAATPLTRKKKVTFKDQLNSCTDASGSQPQSNTKKNKISPAKSINKKKVEEHPRTNKSSLKTTNHVDSSISSKHTVVQIVLWYLDSGCSKYMTGDHSWLMNFVKKFIRTVRFGNDHFGDIMGYGDYMIGDSMISRVYHVEGLGHNLFFVGQFYDSNLEVAFRKHSCYVRDTDGVELINGSCGSNLYTISVKDMLKSSLICLLSKASKNKSWLWHRRLNHLNFGTINDLTRKDLVRGLPRLKFEKDHLCSACQLGKSKNITHTPKAEKTNLEVLYTLYMDLCGPIRVQTINGKKYILVIVDDYSRFTWVKFLRSKDETPEFVINFMKQIQNDVVERRNRTLVEAARTMLIFSKASVLLWAEAVATAWLVPNPVPVVPYVPLINKELEILFQPMFDEYLEPPRVERPVSPAPAVQVPVNSATGTPSSTTIDQDAPSPSKLVCTIITKDLTLIGSLSFRLKASATTLALPG